MMAKVCLWKWLESNSNVSSIGILANNETMSKLTKISLEDSCDFFMKIMQFLMWCSDCPAEGQAKPVRYFASPCMVEAVWLTVYHSGTSCFWIFCRPWCLGGTDVCEVSFFD
jgi:hypothetical protein